MSPSALQRWQSFLCQIEERHRQVATDAVVGARQALPETGFDPQILGQAWAVVDNRLRELEERILDTWNDQVEQVFEREGYDCADCVAARKLGDDLAFRLENSRQSLEMQIQAECARTLYDRASKTQKAHSCPRCGGPWTVPLSYQALNLTCSHCGCVALFEPGMLMRSVLAYGGHALAWQAASAEWMAMRIAERQYRQARSPAPFSVVKDYESAQVAYWTKYCSARAYLEPSMSNIGLEVSSRMQSWYRDSGEYGRRS